MRARIHARTGTPMCASIRERERDVRLSMYAHIGTNMRRHCPLAHWPDPHDRVGDDEARAGGTQPVQQAATTSATRAFRAELAPQCGHQAACPGHSHSFNRDPTGCPPIQLSSSISQAVQQWLFILRSPSRVPYRTELIPRAPKGRRTRTPHP